MSHGLNLIIPILNERHYLACNMRRILELHQAANELEVQFLLVDGGSSDGSIDLLKEANLPFKSQVLAKPSVAKTILLAKDLALSGYLWVVPIDCLPKRQHLEKLKELLESHQDEKIYGAFEKNYTLKGLVLNVQELYLNSFRLRRKHQFVWTNCPFAPCDVFFPLLEKHVEFLSDVKMARSLIGSNLSFKVISMAISCSTRRYEKKGVFKQVFTNLLVMVGERLGVGTERLKLLYRK